MTTHTINVPNWVDPATVDWDSNHGGAPRGIYERDLKAEVTVLEDDGRETTIPVMLTGATDADASSITMFVEVDALRLGSPDQARAFALALLAAADEAESLLAGAR